MRVPAQWPRRLPARIAFLGEAPGSDELDKGRARRESRRSKAYPHYLTLARALHPELPWTGDWRKDYGVAEHLPPYPLVGASGDVFCSSLRQANIERADCWVGNVFEEQAPGNNVSAWLRDEGRMAEVRERLARELAEAGANVIVPLGGTALWVLTGRSDISKSSGAPTLATAVVPGAKLLPLLHPAHVLRTWKMLPIFVAGLERAAREADAGPALHWPWKQLTLEPTLAELRRWVYGLDMTGPDWTGRDLTRLDLTDSRGLAFPTLLNSELVAVDLETGWNQITCVGFAPDHEHAITVPFVDLRKTSRSYWPTKEEEYEAWELVRVVCESPVPKVLQNGPYDAYWLLQRMGIKLNGYCHDTRLMSHALYPELPKDLGTLIALYGSTPQTKFWGAAAKDQEKRDG